MLRYDPADPGWINRDRFVLSSGHASMLLYSLIHLAGVKAVNPSYEQVGRDAVTLEDIRDVPPGRQPLPGPSRIWLDLRRRDDHRSARPGCRNQRRHGDRRATGCGATYNRPGFDLFDFNVYALCGDGDMMEGIASEAASLAGHLRLSNLCWIYDSNRVTIEGHTDIAFTEDVAARFLAYGWNVLRVSDANDMELLEQAYRGFPAHPRSADADRRAQPYRLRRAAQAGFARSPRRAAR